jgi:hypothetical protein
MRMPPHSIGLHNYMIVRHRGMGAYFDGLYCDGFITCCPFCQVGSEVVHESELGLFPKRPSQQLLTHR